MTTPHDANAGEIEGRVVEWVTAAARGVDTSEEVAVRARARRAASLPDDGLEVRPEGWTVEVVLRFAEGDRGRKDDVLKAIAGSTGTVTLENRDAAEIEWPDDAGTALEEATDAPEDKPLQCTVPVYVSIPWPTRNDTSAESM